MNNTIYRVFTQKKAGFDGAAKATQKDILEVSGINLLELKEFLRYDVAGIEEKDFKNAVAVVFSEPQVDDVYIESLPELKGYSVFAIEFLPGQYDQRADSCEQCVQLLTQKDKPKVKCARVFAIKGDRFFDETQLKKVKDFLINPVETREASLDRPTSLDNAQTEIAKVKTIDGFIKLTDKKLEKFYNEFGFAMSLVDLKFVKDSFKEWQRDPTETELKILDTYWSDHCRHTTFMTKLNAPNFEATEKSHPVIKAHKDYLKAHKDFYKSKKGKYPCFMDIATLAAKVLKKEGILVGVDESEEINACSIKIKATVNGEKEDWIINFKNETHNHPTEIEPFGGAATCLGGAIRDPLSGRTYVYQAMRITGAPNPNKPASETLEGKLPRRTITKVAAKGFSSYGNQIGLATGIVKEFYHEGYEAKRLEAGFVIGAAPLKNVRRDTPTAGDIVLMVGGETGRDGCGGAVGSSKSHTSDSLNECGAEVQKGNPLTERKIQRLFKNGACTRLIKRCNDFGAGGVCVAVGEIADGVDINLNSLPKKYDGLSATELAISESQERMAVVVAAGDMFDFIEFAKKENVEAVPIAQVTDKKSMRMFYDGKCIVDLKRDMLNSAGVRQTVDVVVEEKKVDLNSLVGEVEAKAIAKGDYKKAILASLKCLSTCSQKGLIENFDSSIGAGSVLLPLGGKNIITPSKTMAALLPVNGETDTTTICSYGFDPDLSSASPYLGALYAVVESVVSVVAVGVNPSKIYLSLQEYFKKLGLEPKNWGLPLTSLLGAYTAQMGLGLGAIGGKDSMSGTFNELNVPPTLISFAVGVARAGAIISNVFKKADEKVFILKLDRDKFGVPKFDSLKHLLAKLYTEIANKTVTTASVVGRGGAAIAAIKSCLGNDIGFKFTSPDKEIFTPYFGDVVVSTTDPKVFDGFNLVPLGVTTEEVNISIGVNQISLDEALEAFTGVLEPIFPSNPPFDTPLKAVSSFKRAPASSYHARVYNAKPRVIIPVFPGTNCEYDTQAAFEKAGAKVEQFIIKNRSASDISEACTQLAAQIKKSQILMFAGGFSGGDEPDGSGKFISAFFRSPQIKDAVEELLAKREGLALGICNGFQALIKLGLLPYGQIKEPKAGDATLTFNTIGRHISTISKIRVASALSPWLANVKTNDEFLVPISHGEGRFVCSDKDLEVLTKNGQIATQYTGTNPNGSTLGIEGITDPTGRILGKMGHSERVGKYLYKNVPGVYDMKIFEAGVFYFK